MVSNEITTAGTLSTKATKSLDTVRARIVKADEARAAQGVLGLNPGVSR